MLVWTDETGKVTRRHYQPNLLPKEKRTGTVVSEEPPQPAVGRGEVAVAYLRDGECVWEIERRDLTPEERADAAEERLSALLAVAESKGLLTRTEVEQEQSRKTVQRRRHAT